MQKVKKSIGEIKKRLTSFDIFRGVLVLGMIVFHVIYNLSIFQPSVFMLYWIPVGFMMFFGIVIGQFLMKKRKKLLLLAAKLAGIFFLFNSLRFSQVSLQDVLLGNQQIFSFEILWAMALTLVVIAAFSKSLELRIVRLLILFASIAGLVFLDFYDWYSYNAIFILFGIFSVCLGSIVSLDDIQKSITKNQNIILIFIAGLLSFLAYYLELRFLVVLQVFALYFLTIFLFQDNEKLEFLGKNSLFIYVFHIVLIQLIGMVLPQLNSNLSIIVVSGWVVVVSYVSTIAYLFFSKKLKASSLLKICSSK